MAVDVIKHQQHNHVVWLKRRAGKRYKRCGPLITWISAQSHHQWHRHQVDCNQAHAAFEFPQLIAKLSPTSSPSTKAAKAAVGSVCQRCWI